MANIYNWYKKHWSNNGSTENEEYLNEAIENFNSLVDNMEASSVHKIKYTLPLNYDMINKLETNVLISDI